jgi:hypothetical protein
MKKWGVNPGMGVPQPIGGWFLLGKLPSMDEKPYFWTPPYITIISIVETGHKYKYHYPISNYIQLSHINPLSIP